MTRRRIRRAFLAIPLLALAPAACTVESIIGDPTALGAVRVAHLSPGLPALDFCVAGADGVVWAGPLASCQ